MFSSRTILLFIATIGISGAWIQIDERTRRDFERIASYKFDTMLKKARENFEELPRLVAEISINRCEGVDFLLGVEQRWRVSPKELLMSDYDCGTDNIRDFCELHPSKSVVLVVPIGFGDVLAVFHCKLDDHLNIDRQYVNVNGVSVKEPKVLLETKKALTWSHLIYSLIIVFTALLVFWVLYRHYKQQIIRQKEHEEAERRMEYFNRRRWAQNVDSSYYEPSFEKYATPAAKIVRFEKQL